MGVYAEVREFVLAHRPCAGPRQANAGPPTVRLGAPVQIVVLAPPPLV
jgi:hypothetical protein